MTPARVIEALFVLGDDLACQALHEGGEALLLDAARAARNFRLDGWERPGSAAEALILDVASERLEYVP